VKQRLKEALSRRRKIDIDDSGRIPSAVLLPIFEKDGEYHILCIKRTQRVSVHRGEISFPGGAYEEQDGTLLNTALRESEEEIGLAQGVVEVLGELDDIVTLATGYHIASFVAAIPWPLTLEADAVETEEIIEIPIPALLDKDCFSEGKADVDGKIIDSLFYRYQDRVIWGATARILKQFLEVWAEVMGDVG